MKARALRQLPVVLSLLAAPAWAQNADPSKVKLGVTVVTKGISMIEGVEGFAGGNVAVSVGSDGVFIIDDELEVMSAKLQAEIAKLSKQPVRFVINTHFHGDHAGGNTAFGSAGAVILAHDNVRRRLSVAELEQAKDKVVASNFISPDAIVEAAYKSLTASPVAGSPVANSPAAAGAAASGAAKPAQRP